MSISSETETTIISTTNNQPLGLFIPGGGGAITQPPDICCLNTLPTQTVRVFYRINATDTGDFNETAYFRYIRGGSNTFVNSGAVINTYQNIGSYSPTPFFTFGAYVNDVINFNVISTSPPPGVWCVSYTSGFNGGYFGGCPTNNSYTVINGVNNIYLNICVTTTYINDPFPYVQNSFCYSSPY